MDPKLILVPSGETRTIYDQLIPLPGHAAAINLRHVISVAISKEPGVFALQIETTDKDRAFRFHTLEELNEALAPFNLAAQGG